MVGLCLKVLAFEDSVDIESLLNSGGIDTSKLEIKQCWNSSMYLEIINNYKPEILLLDHYMPPTKGLVVLRGLLQSDLQRPRIIVAMSSASIANNAMVESGADFGITKFNLPELEFWPR